MVLLGYSTFSRVNFRRCTWLNITKRPLDQKCSYSFHNKGTKLSAVLVKVYWLKF